MNGQPLSLVSLGCRNAKIGSELMSKAKVLRIGNAGGYWGDDPHALKRQLEKGPLDYITMDFLAEVTMSILKKQKIRDASLGYATDFIKMLYDTLPLLFKNG